MKYEICYFTLTTFGLILNTCQLSKQFAIPYYIVENSKILVRIIWALGRNLLFCFLKLFIIFYQFLSQFLFDFNKRTIVKEYLFNLIK